MTTGPDGRSPVNQPHPRDELRVPDTGMRGRRREAGSCVVSHVVAPPPVADSYAPGVGIPDVPREERAVRESRETSDSSVIRSTGSMAVANLASRITGFVRMILILAVLGPAVASAFNIANTLPAMITELVLGSVLTAMFMPLLARSAREDPDGGVAFIRRLVTLTGTVGFAAAAIAVFCAPLLTLLNLGDGEVNTDLATAFAYLLLPQIFFFGLFSVLMAVLNYNEVFKPAAWAPVCNNVVAIGTLSLYALIGSRIDPDAPVKMFSPEILLLGLGTTFGIVVQAAVLLPALKRCGIDLRPLWGIDTRLRQFGPSAAAGFVYVLISQVGLVVTNRIGSAADASAVAIYQTHWLLLQVPYGVIGVTLLTAINPRLADNGTAGRTRAVVRDVSLGTRLLLVGLVPVLSAMAVFGGPIAQGLFAYGRFDADRADILGMTLTAGAFTLVPYAIVLLQQRVYYAREDYWTPTATILVVTVVRVVASLLVPAFAQERSHVVVGLALANGIGWVVGAALGFVLLRRALGPLDGRQMLRTAAVVVPVSLLSCLVALGLDRLLHLGGLADAFGSPGSVLRVAIDVLVSFALIGLVLMRSRLPELAGVRPVVSGVVRRLTGGRRG